MRKKRGGGNREGGGHTARALAHRGEGKKKEALRAQKRGASSVVSERFSFAGWDGKRNETSRGRWVGKTKKWENSSLLLVLACPAE